jgi:eukaryotic-like serine/threonine-protein kinase
LVKQPQDVHSRLADYRRGLARYAPSTRIASGGMGEVWRGEAIFSDGYTEPVAIKRVLPWLANTPLYREMLEDEARLGMMLQHPNIVRVYDARMQGSFILVMELVDGKPLHHVLGRLRRAGLRVPLEAALHIVHKLAAALSYAHQAVDDSGRALAIVHGDVSPHNVLVSVTGEVKLMDFGLSRATANLAARDPNRVCGKPGYAAPELVTRKECSQAGDLFALGVILWECLSGRRLFYGASPRETLQMVRACDVPPIRVFRPDAPIELEALLHALLCLEPQSRPNAQRVIRELSRIQARFDAGLGALATSSVMRRQLNDAMRKQPFATPLAPLGSTQARFLRPDADEVITSVYEQPAEQSVTLEWG